MAHGTGLNPTNALVPGRTLVARLPFFTAHATYILLPQLCCHTFVGSVPGSLEGSYAFRCNFTQAAFLNL